MNVMVKYLLITILIIGRVYSQSIEDNLKSMANANAKKYLGAFPTAFGMNMNSGTFHKAKPHKVLGFDITMSMSMAATSDAAQTFEFILPAEDILVPITIAGQQYELEINPDEVYDEFRTTSTIFGPPFSNTISVDNDKAINSIRTQLAGKGVAQNQIDLISDSELAPLVDENFPALVTPEGLNLPFIPALIPQISIGFPKDIELSFRGFPSSDIPEYGKVEFLGYGGKIGLNQFIPVPNIVLPDMALGYYAINLTMGDIIKMNNSITMFQISKSIPFLTVYGGLGLESTTADLNYSYADALSGTSTPIHFSNTGENNFRTVIGMMFKLAILSINADYNIGAFNTLNMGIGITLR